MIIVVYRRSLMVTGDLTSIDVINPVQRSFPVGSFSVPIISVILIMMLMMCMFIINNLSLEDFFLFETKHTKEKPRYQRGQFKLYIRSQKSHMHEQNGDYENFKRVLPSVEHDFFLHRSKIELYLSIIPQVQLGRILSEDARIKSSEATQFYL